MMKRFVMYFTVNAETQPHHDHHINNDDTQRRSNQLHSKN